ncbi:hypothetical protein [Bernardetia sp. MNP-M8]|uniref:hypothetical protein n=1 Tax=Bernardetia sp. MNP-M8 TaxID=3127470 RepID=UPI0030CD926D
MKFSSKAKSSLTEKRAKEVEELNITEEPIYTFSVTPQIKRDLVKARMYVEKNNKKGIFEIKQYIKKYPHVNTFYNYLSNMYRLQDRKEEEYEILKLTIKKFPTYVFANLSLMNYYLSEENIEKLDDMFNGIDNIQDFFPNKTVFHDSEITAFYSTYLHYLAYKQEEEKIKEVWNMLEILATEYDGIEYKLPTIKSIYSYTLMNTKMLGITKRVDSMISIKPTNTSSVKENDNASQPTFNHEEINQLYIVDIEELTKEKIDMFLSLPKKTFIEDLEMVLEDIQTRKKYFYKGDVNYSLPYYVLTLLSVLEAKESVNKMLNIFRQDKRFIEFWFGFYLEPSYIGLIFYKFFRDDFEGIFEFVREKNNEYGARAGLINIPAQVALDQPTRRKEVVDFYETLADFFIDNKNDKEIIDHNAIEYLTHGIKTIEGKELREKVLELDKAGLVNDFLDGIDDILEEIDAPFYSTMQSEKIDITMSVYEIFEKLKQQKEFFLPNTEEEEERAKEHRKKIMEKIEPNSRGIEGLKELLSGVGKNEDNDSREVKSASSNPYLNKPTIYQRNDKVTVKYQNGKVIENTKYKKVEKDVKAGKCVIV